MKNLEPYIEIKIISEEQKIYKWLKITSNTAYISDAPGAHYKINGNEFFKILEHHKQSVIDYYNAGLSTSDILDLCYIKITVEDKLYEFNFNYSNSDLLNFANVLYRDLKTLIDFYYINYDDIEWNIVKEIKNLPLKTKGKIQFKTDLLISGQYRLVMKISDSRILQKNLFRLLKKGMKKKF